MKSKYFPPIDEDLFVVNNPPDEKEMKELNAFIEKLQKKQGVTKTRKPSGRIRKAKKYEVSVADMPLAREPKPGHYVKHKTRKLAPKRKPARPRGV